MLVFPRAGTFFLNYSSSPLNNIIFIPIWRWAIVREEKHIWGLKATATEDSWSLAGIPSVCPEVKLGLEHCLGGDVKAALGTLGRG